MDESNDESYDLPFDAGYNREKALTYWHQQDLDDVLTTMASQMASTMSHIRAYVEDAFVGYHVVDILQSQNKTSLVQTVQSIRENYKTVRAMVEIIYLYDRNWDRKKMLAKNGETMMVNEMRFPENLPAVYESELPVWYEKEPTEFLQITIPVAEPEILNFHALVKSLYDTHGLDKIVLSDNVEITLERIISNIFKESWMLSEEFFLLNSCSRSHSK